MTTSKLLGTFADTNNNDVVSTVGAQTIAGIKTFSDPLKPTVIYAEIGGFSNGTTWTSTTTLPVDSIARLTVLHIGGGSTVGNIGEYLVGRVSGNNGVVTVVSANSGGITYTVTISAGKVVVTSSATAFCRISLGRIY